MRKSWAAILAGEIRRPGSVSLMTLQLMSLVDQETAFAIKRVVPYIVSNADSSLVPVMGEFRNDPFYDGLISLDALGFLTLGMHQLESNKFVIGQYSFQTKSDRSFPIAGAVLTPAGKQLFGLLEQQTTIEEATYVLAQINSESYISPPILIYDLISDNIVPFAKI